MRLFTTLVSATFALANLTATPTEDGLYAVFKTSQGDFTAKLFYQLAPLSSANMVGLAEGTLPHYATNSSTPIYSRFYDGLTLHQAVDAFKIQGGDPVGDGSGGPGYQWYDEVRPGLQLDQAGILAMANSGPNSNGSQFFITVAPTPSLNGLHNVFGEIVEGYENVEKISKLPTTGYPNHILSSPITIESVNILRIGESAEAFDPTFYADRFDPYLPLVRMPADSVLYPHLSGPGEILASTPYQPLTDFKIKASDDLVNWSEVARHAPSLRKDVQTITTTLVSPIFPTPQYMKLEATRGQITDMVGIAERIEGNFTYGGQNYDFRFDFEDGLEGTYTLNGEAGNDPYDWIEIGDDRVQLLIPQAIPQQYFLTWTSSDSGTVYFRYENSVGEGTFTLTPVE